MFEKATRLKLRFKTVLGVLNVEDLWDLSLRDLDAIAVDLRKKVEDAGESFISEVKVDEKLQLAFDITKRVIVVKLEEREAAKVAKEKRERKAKILSILASKQEAALGEMSQEALLKELEALG